jgi:glyoxylase I family protein
MRYVHCGLTVADIDRSRHFYADLLGLKEVFRPDMGFPGAWYGVGDLQLHLMVPPPGRPVGNPDTQFAGRVNHLAFGVPGWEAVVDRLRAADVPVRDSAPAPGYPRRVFVKDPDGNVLELVDGD